MGVRLPLPAPFKTTAKPLILNVCELALLVSQSDITVLEFRFRHKNRYNPHPIYFQ